MDISLKNLLLAGIGSIAMTYEKGSVLVDELVKKGELTVNQGKQLNEELIRKMGMQMPGSQAPAGITVEIIREAVAGLNLATRDEINTLKQRLEVLESRANS